MISPGTVHLTPQLKELQEKWLEAKREEQDLVYAKEFGPVFMPLFVQLPLHNWTGDRPQFKALISVLGFSWQPVALMAAWAKPEIMLLLGSKDSLSNEVGEESVLELISRLSEVPLHCLLSRQIQEPEEVAIYREVRAFVQQHRLSPQEIALDPTGGKKSMSASAAMAGFLAGAWIVYVDYAEYHPEKRIPIAGTEFPRLLRNPLEVFGELEFDRIKEAYRNGNYQEACHIAETLAGRLYEPREAEALALLSKGYGLWHRFHFGPAYEALEKLRVHLERFASFGRWQWTGDMLMVVQNQSSVVKQLADLTTAVCAGEKPRSVEEGLPLVLNHLAAAERSLAHQHLGASVLLAYATLERYVDLCLWVYYSLDDEAPDFSDLNLDLNAFHEVGRRLHGKNYQEREPGGAITLSLGIQLLASLKPDLMPVQFMGRLRGLMSDRNKCEFEHGLCPKEITKDKLRRHIGTVKNILQIHLNQLGRSVDVEVERYTFPRI